MSLQADALGGYFELELPSGFGSYYECALKYQSARAAFYSLLDGTRPRRVWMPYYICDTMLTPLYKLDIEVKFYSIDSNFAISSQIELLQDDLFLYVNYFGIRSTYEDYILTQFDKSQVIFDHSQAFFCAPKDCLATIYSPRKFFGVPDGGLLVTESPIIQQDCRDEASIDRTEHLLRRLAGTAEDGYLSYLEAEKSLNDVTPKRMSLLTERMLASIDYESIRQKRSLNFLELHEKLAGYNQIEINVNDIDGPMVYPLLPKGMSLPSKSELIAKRCYIATYWPECKTRLSHFLTEKFLVDNLLTLPCDQRVSSNDLMGTLLYER